MFKNKREGAGTTALGCRLPDAFIPEILAVTI